MRHGMKHPSFVGQLVGGVRRVELKQQLVGMIRAAVGFSLVVEPSQKYLKSFQMQMENVWNHLPPTEVVASNFCSALRVSGALNRLGKHQRIGRMCKSPAHQERCHRFLVVPLGSHARGTTENHMAAHGNSWEKPAPPYETTAARFEDVSTVMLPRKSS